MYTNISQITSKSARTIPKPHRRWNDFFSDGIRWPDLSANIVVIQTHLSGRYYIAVDFLGLT